MFYYIYKTTNTINGKYYIGKHSTKTLENDYLGSGVSLKKAIEKYGRDSFVKEILEFCDSAEQLAKREAELVTEDVARSPNTYNQKAGGIGGSLKGTFTHTAEFRAKISQSNKTRDKTNMKKRDGGERWWNNGTTQTYALECPGSEWVAGMIRRSTRPKFKEELKSKPFWTNGIETTKAWESPGPEWYRGMRKRKAG